MKKKILTGSLFFLSLVTAIGAWLSVSRAILVPGSSVWLVPLTWFCLFYCFFSLEAVLLGKSLWTKLSAFASLFGSLFFVVNFLHFVILLVSGFILLLSLHQIDRDVEDNIRLSSVRALYSGRIIFILAVSLAISSQYYFQASASGLLKIPTFDVNEFLSRDWTRKIFFALSPDWQKEGKIDLTVDEYLWESYLSGATQGETDEISRFLPAGQKYSTVALEKAEQLKKEQVLLLGREQLGKSADRTLTGEEKIVDVFSEMINNRLNAFFSSGMGAGRGELVVPGVMTATLFLTILSLGSFVTYLAVYLVALIVWFLIKMGVVKITTVSVEKEVLW